MFSDFSKAGTWSFHQNGYCPFFAGIQTCHSHLLFYSWEVIPGFHYEPLYLRGAVRLIFDKLEHQLGTYDFLSLFNTIPNGSRIRVRRSWFFRNRDWWHYPFKYLFLRSHEEADKRWYWTGTLCSAWFCPKKTSFEFHSLNGIWEPLWIISTPLPEKSWVARTPYDVALWKTTALTF